MAIRSRPILLSLALAVAAIAALAPAPVAATKYNITKILEPYKEYSKFNDMLSKTRLAYDINRRQTITVLAVDNAAMSALDHYSLQTIRHILSLHVLVDYYGDKKLNKLAHGSTASSSMFQATGSASGMSGYVNITRKDGKVSFTAEDADESAKPSRYVKSIKEFPYDIAVLQVSSIISSAEAEAPVPAPAPVDLVELLSKRYCRSFAALLAADAEAFRAVNESKDSGLTLFCPVDAAVAAFAAAYKNNLTAKGARTAVLLYHAVPDYFSLQLLKSNNGMVTTLATTSDRRMDYSYDVRNKGETVTLRTRVVTSSVTATVADMEPLAVYAVDKFLKPKELFKVVEAPAPAPEPSKTKKGGGVDDGSSDDSTADADKGDAAPALLARWVVTVATTAVAAYALTG